MSKNTSDSEAEMEDGTAIEKWIKPQPVFDRRARR
jgi:hypothetical protein